MVNAIGKRTVWSVVRTIFAVVYLQLLTNTGTATAPVKREEKMSKRTPSHRPLASNTIKDFV